MTPVRVQLRRSKGWRMPPNTVKVDRTTRWGNPFVVGEHGDRAACVQAFHALVAGHIVASPTNASVQQAYQALLTAQAATLRGRNLACWCPLDAPCHADALLALANANEDRVT